MDNKTFLEKLKFSISDKNLHYYLYNWRCPNMSPDKVLITEMSPPVKTQSCYVYKTQLPVGRVYFAKEIRLQSIKWNETL